MKGGNQMVSIKRGVKTPTIDWKPIKSGNTSLKKTESDSKSPFARKIFFGLMVAMPIVSFGLGCWQVKRLQWKTTLIANAERELALEPLERLPPNLDPNAVKDFEYRRFKCRGHFDYSQEMFLGPRMKDGMLGYLVIVPFIRADGGKPILVERGWISKDKVVPSTRKGGYLEHLALPEGEIEIVALFRNMPAKSSLQYDHVNGDRLFHVPDVEAMSKQSGALPVYSQMIYDLSDHVEWRKDVQKESDKSKLLMGLLFHGKEGKRSENVEDALFVAHEAAKDQTLRYQEFEFIEQGVPIAATPKVKFTNNHLQYLVTWFGLAFCSAGLLAYNIISRRRYNSAEKIIAAKRKDMGKKW
ncbi:surf-like protein [Scheffersomyces spartinae]|uniref:SURF1-like protein n=1 Tax=Scheffersomyces spartinae TaxID=45513 RepID=A0A9P7VD43_9ASCO|nr:surf-like protein [Scheffersomyces spartinae]KAG7195607.1 surf-like protein [Scheffersomyces spartinae]